MKWRQFLFSIITLLSSLANYAQSDTLDSDALHSSPSRYDCRIDRYEKRWSSLIPAHIKLQYAGNMGFMSLGWGWDYGKRRQWETDIMIGYIPRFKSDQAKATFSLKQNYIPLSLQIKQSRWAFEPIECGLYFNTLPYKEFWYRNPKRYGKGYYEYCSRMRVNIFAGQRINFDIPESKRDMIKTVTAFYEVSTYDMMFVSACQNKSLKPNQYLTLSVGIKLQIL